MGITLSQITNLIELIKDDLFPNIYNQVDDVSLLCKEVINKINCYVTNNIEEARIIYKQIKSLKKELLKDAIFAYKSDPACSSIKEVIMLYPGFSAIVCYRIARIFYLRGEKLISRGIMEYVHSKTGIDIHPGARIGNYFFIDHGVGVVIGETAIIGNRVKIYQGVTLGAISLSKGRKVKNTKRHPTLKNDVTIYSNSSILGGDTIIGNNVIIGNNIVITSSIEDNKIILQDKIKYRLISKEKK